jgi:hypothetical protein
MIIVDEALKMAPKTSFVEHDDVIEALAADRSDQSFHIGRLPGESEAWKELLLYPLPAPVRRTLAQRYDHDRVGRDAAEPPFWRGTLRPDSLSQMK